MEKTRYYAIKDPTGEIRVDSVVVANGEESAWEKLYNIGSRVGDYFTYKSNLRANGFKCVELAEVERGES